jgi:hypothetical protein
VSLPIFRSLILSPWEALEGLPAKLGHSNMFPGVRHASWKALGMLPGKHPRNVPISISLQTSWLSGQTCERNKWKHDDGSRPGKYEKLSSAKGANSTNEPPR